MIRILNLMIILMIFGCLSPKTENKSNEGNEQILQKYPEVVDSMGLQDKYDLAKWNLYCVYCDDTIRLRHKSNSSSINKTFGSLDLRFQEVERRNDSVEFKFYFYIDSIRCDLETVENFGNKFFADGVLFIKDSLAFYTTPTTMKYFWQGGIQNRFFNPLQPEVLAFIKNNKDKLNPWFREEARHRNIIEE